MKQPRTDLSMTLTFRPQEDADLPGVLNLINNLRMPGEPVLSPDGYQQLTARSGMAVHVATDSSGHVLGTVSTSVRAGDGSGLIHWLYTQPDSSPITAALLSHACASLGPRHLSAFSEPRSSALAAVPGLPLNHYSWIVDALIDAHFTPCSQQRFLLLDDLLYTQGPPAAAAGEPRVAVKMFGQRRGWRVVAQQGTAIVASAVMLEPRDNTALLWQLNVSLRHRRQGLGRRLLGHCLDLAAANGARQVAAYVDRHDSALYRMLLFHRFHQVDSLVTYQRTL